MNVLNTLLLSTLGINLGDLLDGSYKDKLSLMRKNNKP